MKCEQCGKAMNAVEYLMSSVCGKCTRKNQKEMTKCFQP